ncbi:MAG: hypothetical protein HKP30_17975 [Myxococcales bacterium]|nr:hypothetical protein [Myxococcales bacterium]
MRALVGFVSLVAIAWFGCASSESMSWQRPCGTPEQREVDRDSCLTEAAGIADPSGRGVEYSQDLFRRCMEERGWQRVPSGTVLECR